MKPNLRHATLLLALLLAAPVTLAAQTPTTDEAQLPAQLRESRTALNSAYSGLRAEDALAHYADDVRVVFNGQEFRGKPAARAWLNDALAGLAALRMGAPNFTLRENEVLESAGYTVTRGGGEPASGMVETLWRLHEGSWRVATMLVVISQ
jgi:ketosteroid isomerase-like protein